MSTPALYCKNLVKRFDGHTAVNSFDLFATKGELLSLIGPSGCGKTTVLRLIAGLDQLDDGQIQIAGVEVANASKSVAPERRHVGMVFQDFALFPHMSLAQNVLFGVPKDRGNREAAVDKYLTIVGLKVLKDRMPDQLSGGEQQRGALARALIAKPDILLLDEPFSNLDPILRHQVREDVCRIIRDSGVTAVLVTHDIEEALSVADRVAVMMNGSLQQVDSPENLYCNPSTEELADWIGATNFLDGLCEGDTAVCEIGRVSLQQECHGKRRLMLRPEWLKLTPTAKGECQVVGHTFYGHGQMFEVALESGRRLLVRSVSNTTILTGQQVSVSSTRPAITFPV